MFRVRVTRSGTQGTGVVMYNTIGTNTFTQCEFSDNINTYPEFGGGGGGFYVEFTYCLPGVDTCLNSTEESFTKNNKDSTYIFSNCNFSRNNATNEKPIKGQTTYILPLRQYHNAFGRGGGLSFFFKANATGNKVVVENCNFVENVALWGGGLFVEFEDTATGNDFSVFDSAFEGNSLLSGIQTSGGGLRIGHYVYANGVIPKGNAIVVENCSFSSNTGVSGGALSYSAAGQKTSDELSSLSITDCVFVNNSATIGLAIHIMKFSLMQGPVCRVAITNLKVWDSFPIYTDPTQAYQIRGGAVYVNEIGVDIIEQAEFTRNQDTAFVIVGADASFQNCTGVFDSNEGLKGGAMLLLGHSFFSVNESTVLEFINNTAMWYGGAIFKQYADRDNMAKDPHCFVQHANPFLSPDDWGTEFHFTNNSDHQGKVAIHATSLYPCVWAGGLTIGNINDVFCWKNWFYNNKTSYIRHCKKHLSSSAGNITFNYTFEAFPGLEAKLPITTRDDFGRKREVAFHSFSLDTETAQIDPAFEYIAGDTIRFTGIEGESFILELDSTSQRIWHLEFNVTVLSCPPGYRATSLTNKSTCECQYDAYDGNLICEQEDYTASLNGGYWMGKVGRKTFVARCPPQYCLTERHHKFLRLPQDFSQLDEHICGGQKRTGVLCGECVTGHGPAINSLSKRFDCVPCKNVNLPAQISYYVLLEYVPLFLLFLAIIVFNIKLTTGPANAFILFSQVISSTFDITADGQIPLESIAPSSRNFILAYHFPYGVFNLKFFEQLAKPFCFSTKFNVLDVLTLEYGVGFFPLFMILMVIVYIKLKGVCSESCCRLPRCSDKCKRFLPRLGDSIIPAFASFLLLSYSKLILTSSYMISQHILTDNDNDDFAERVYYAGQYSSTDPEYILRYMLPSIIILVFIGSLPLLLLLHYPLHWFELALSKVWWLKRHYPSTKIQIFLDAFQGCFKPRMRFFAGLYFIFRLVIDLSYMLSQTWSEHCLIQVIVCVIFIFLLAVCQPYGKEYNIFNYIDAAMFANLAIITALGHYIYAMVHINTYRNPPAGAFWIQYFLIFLPLLLVLGYIIWRYAIPRIVQLGHRMAGNIQHSTSSQFIESSVFVNSRASGTWSFLSRNYTSGAGGGGRRRNRSSIENSVDWQRATLKNTYCRSPSVRRDSLDSAPVNEGRGEEEEEEEGSSALNSHGLHTPLLKTGKTYTPAVYGSILTTTDEYTSGTTGNSNVSSDQLSNPQGQPTTTQNASNE